MIVRTILVGFAIEAVSIDELQKPGWHYTYYNNVSFEVWGTLDINVTGKGKHHVIWDTRHPISWRNYLDARERLFKTPIPYGTCSTPSSISAGSALPLPS